MRGSCQHDHLPLDGLALKSNCNTTHAARARVRSTVTTPVNMLAAAKIDYKTH